MMLNLLEILALAVSLLATEVVFQLTRLVTQRLGCDLSAFSDWVEERIGT